MQLRSQIRHPGIFIFIVFAAILLFCLASPGSIHSQTLPGFIPTPNANEQVVTFRRIPDIRIHINAPAAAEFDPKKPVGLALYALPNGNTIEQTVGKVMQPGDDWHFDIQHIGAQTRFLRQKIETYTLVTVYLEAEQKSWPAWKSRHPAYAKIVSELVAYLVSYFRAYKPFIILTGHSGGGRFIFSYLDAVAEIPNNVRRICFLDSNYGYENSYGDKLIRWLKASPDHFLSVIAYNDSVALYNGQPVVSPTGGTWYRSRMMQRYFAQHFEFSTTEDAGFIRHEALQGRIEILLKKNPERKILHTVLVERNGFVHSMLTGTPLENTGYTYYGERAYTHLIQQQALPQSSFQIPLRDPAAPGGAAFMDSIKALSFDEREAAILAEITTGNLPYFYRNLKLLTADFNDTGGNSHQVAYRVMPDYLAVGSDSDFCRIPMGPITAQRIADFFGATLPTRKLVDHIYRNAEIKLAPVTYAPVGNNNEKVEKFIEHNAAIQQQFREAGGVAGQLVGGTKKDVVLSNKITDPNRPNHVVIYGWHRLNGNPIQPLTNIHNNRYVDYSHGIRLLAAEFSLDGKPKQIRAVLQDPVLYRVLSDESGPMQQPTYIAGAGLPEKPRAYGVRCEQNGELHLMISPAANVDRHLLYLSEDGIHFREPIAFAGNDYVIRGLPANSVVYLRLRAENAAGQSIDSEVLAAVPRAGRRPEVLIVNGFDRLSSGNTFNFIRQHAAAIFACGASFAAATNDAIIDGLFRLGDYGVAVYILGNESTADETFSSVEQELVAAFLRNGGGLFVSGAEIAWDLDYKGSSRDKAFFHEYLKAKYSADAPGNTPGTYYSARGIAGGLFADIPEVLFDDGTHGTYNVKWADALIPTGGGMAVLRYKGVTTHNIGGISFEGTFKNGSKPGRLVYLGFPFETIYPDTTRRLIMQKALEFLMPGATAIDTAQSIEPERYALEQNYPNPFNTSTIIEYVLPKRSEVTITIYNSLGATVRQWLFSGSNAGRHSIHWDGTDGSGRRVGSGNYFCRLRANDGFIAVRKLVLMK